MPIPSGYTEEIKSKVNNTFTKDLPWGLILYANADPRRVKMFHPFSLGEEVFKHFEATGRPSLCLMKHYGEECPKCAEPGYMGQANNPQRVLCFLGYDFDAVDQPVKDKHGKDKKDERGAIVMDNALKVAEVSGGNTDFVNFSILESAHNTYSKGAKKPQFEEYIWVFQHKRPPQCLKPINFEEEFNPEIPKNFMDLHAVTIESSNEEKDRLRVKILQRYAGFKPELFPTTDGTGTLKELSDEILAVRGQAPEESKSKSASDLD